MPQKPEVVGNTRHLLWTPPSLDRRRGKIWVELHKQFALDVSRTIARWGITTSLALTVLIGYRMDHRLVDLF